MTTKYEVLNKKGEPITLNAQEQFYCNAVQAKINAEYKNTLGFEIPITTLTTIQKKVIEQKFFEIEPSKYIPIRVGVGAWGTNLLTYTAGMAAGDFETGIINDGGNMTRLAGADALLDSITVPISTWAKEINWSLPEMKFAATTGVFDVIEMKEKARKKNWDLGIQKIAFLGNSAGTQNGLLTLPGVTANASFITTPIKLMNTTQFQTFIGGLISLYRAQVNFTMMPNRFYIPETDYTGLAAAANEEFPLKSKLERLIEAFRAVTMNPDFQVLPLVYAGQQSNSLGKNRYVLCNMDDDNFNMNVPVPYTTTAVNGTFNGFQYSNVGYGQWTGVQVNRPGSVLYLDLVGVIN